MNILSPELPGALRTNTVVKHLSDPYSEAALAEPHKDFIDLGRADTSTLPGPVSLRVSNTTSRVKASGKKFVAEDMPAEYRELGSRFVALASYLLDPEAFAEAAITVRHKRGALTTGHGFTELDAHLEDAFPSSRRPGLAQLRMLGFATNVLPTGVIQGPVARADFNVPTNSLDPGVIVSRNLQAEELPLDRLVVIGGGQPHFAQAAPQPIDMRHHLRFDLYL